MSETTPAARAAEEENADLPALPSPLLDLVALAAALVAVVAIGLLIDIVAGAIAAGTSLAAWFVGRQGTVRGMRRDVHRLVGVVDSTPAALKDAPDAEAFGMLSPVAARVGRLQARLESAIEAATTDRLTHVANRPMLLAQLYDEVERSSRYGRPLTIACRESRRDRHHTGHGQGRAMAGLRPRRDRRGDSNPESGPVCGCRRWSVG